MRYFIASLGGFQFGYTIGIMAGALLFIATQFELSPHHQGILASAILMGAIPGAACAGPLSNRIGRKKVQQLIAGLFFLGSLLLFLDQTFSIILTGRILQGVGVGAIAVVAPIYLAEIAPNERRGHYVGFYQLAITIGILVAYTLNFVLQPHWRWMFGLGAIPAVVHGIGFYFLPESLPSEPSHVKLSSLPKKPVLITIFLNVFQQITGINAIIYFAPSIFLSAGFATNSLALLPPILIALTNIGATYLSLLLIDRVGRRPLLLTGIGGMTFSLLALITSYLIGMKSIAVGSLLLYIASFGISLGPIPPLISSEVLPLRYRAHGMSIGLFSNLLCNFAVVFTFLDLTTRISHAATFAIYAVCGVAALLIAWKYIPETKGISID